MAKAQDRGTEPLNGHSEEVRSWINAEVARQLEERRVPPAPEPRKWYSRCARWDPDTSKHYRLKWMDYGSSEFIKTEGDGEVLLVRIMETRHTWHWHCRAWDLDGELVIDFDESSPQFEVHGERFKLLRSRLDELCMIRGLLADWENHALMLDVFAVLGWTPIQRPIPDGMELDWCEGCRAAVLNNAFHPVDDPGWAWSGYLCNEGCYYSWQMRGEVHKTIPSIPAIVQSVTERPIDKMSKDEYEKHRRRQMKEDTTDWQKLEAQAGEPSYERGRQMQNERFIERRMDQRGNII